MWWLAIVGLRFCSLFPTYKKLRELTLPSCIFHLYFCCYNACEVWKWIVNVFCDCEMQGFIVFNFVILILFCALCLCNVVSLLFLRHCYWTLLRLCVIVDLLLFLHIVIRLTLPLYTIVLLFCCCYFNYMYHAYFPLCLLSLFFHIILAPCV